MAQHPGFSVTLQGYFPGGRPHVVGADPEAAVAQPRGHATELPPSVLGQLGHRRGEAMPEGVQQKMEAAFGADFSDVRVHVGSQAGSIGALAFTLGSDIYFAPGLYSPDTVHGQRLLGHELTHVLQQRHGRVRNPFGTGVAVVQDPGLEAEADRMGMMAASHAFAPAPAPSGEAQAKPEGSTPGSAPGSPAPHVQAAIQKTSAQAKPAQVSAAQPKAAEGPAPHVQAAIQRSSAQARPNEPAQARPGQAKPAAAAPARAAHVQAAIQKTSAQAKPEPAQAKPAQSKPAGGYRLVLGAYMHRQNPGSGAIPEDLAGHTFVSIQTPGGRAETWGFSPRDGNYDPNRDLGRLRAGVQGKIHDDAKAFAKAGVRTRSFEISQEQAKAAAAKVAEFRAENQGFSLQQRQCSSFAIEVARAAGVEGFAGSGVRTPRDVYNKL